MELMNKLRRHFFVMFCFVGVRWNSKDEWETCYSSTDTEWRSLVEPVMRSYMEATDGTSIEFKESALVWHHQDADPDFGSCQAKELLDHLESVLANEPVVVKRGQHIVEVKPQVCKKQMNVRIPHGKLERT